MGQRKKFEYMNVRGTYDGFHAGKAFYQVDRLNELGSEGWQAVAVVFAEMGNGASVLMMREVMAAEES